MAAAILPLHRKPKRELRNLQMPHCEAIIFINLKNISQLVFIPQDDLHLKQLLILFIVSP